MRNSDQTRRKAIADLVHRGQSALELGKTKTTIVEYLRISAPIFELEAQQHKTTCVWVEDHSHDSEDL